MRSAAGAYFFAFSLVPIAWHESQSKPVELIRDEHQQVIETWDDAKHQIEDIVSTGTSRFGRGGMHSKLTVARKTAALGTEVFIADGRADEVLRNIAGGRPTGTRFPASSGSSPAKRWLEHPGLG